MKLNSLIVSFETNKSLIVTSMFLLMSKSRYLKTSVFFLPIVEFNAIICRFILVISTTSKSTIVSFPIPDLAKDSVTKEPTPVRESVSVTSLRSPPFC